uniref:Uncharacterized protein n=1 Tax=Strigamia maritima TaxID=126957 RepID=T1J450_STRMM
MKCVSLMLLIVSMTRCQSEEDLNCICSVMIIGDDQIFVRYTNPMMKQHVDDCTNVDSCKQKCDQAMNKWTENGNLNATPFGSNYTVGDIGCQMLGIDVDLGIGKVFASLCGDTSAKTDFKFQSNFCCRNWHHRDNCARKSKDE